MNTIVVKKAVAEIELQHVFAIRKKVFVEEQHCPPELEYAYEDVSTHFLAVWDGTPCGAARWRQTDKGYKLERFAVLPEYRGKGVGGKLVESVLADLPASKTHVYLNAQLAAEKFYEQYGFNAVGEVFEEAGIMHRQMMLAS